MSYSKPKSSSSAIDKKISLFNRQQERVNSAIENLSMNYYTIYGIISKMHFKPSELIETACVDKYGRGLFNPNFIEDLSKKEVEFVIMHEVYHVLLRHMKRFEAHVGEGNGNISLFNIAADAFINENLISSKNFKHSSIEGTVDFDYINNITKISKQELAKMTTESVYDKLLELEGDDSNSSQGEGNSSNQNNTNNGNGANNNNNNNNSNSNGANNNSSSSNGNGANNNNSNGGSSESSNEDSESSSSSEENNSSNNASQDNADPMSNDMSYSDIIEQEYGKAGSALKDSLEKSINSVYCDASSGISGEKRIFKYVENECNVDIDSILKDFAYKVSGRGESTKTYRRPNKYYMDVYPHTKGRVKRAQKDVVFSIDVSGSMDKKKISQAIAFIDKYQAKYGVGTKYYFFSNEASPVYTYTNKKDFLKKLELYYGGGTTIYAALRTNEKEKVQDIANGIVIVSDMEFFEGNKVAADLINSQSVYCFGVGIDTNKRLCKTLFGSDFINM